MANLAALLESEASAEIEAILSEARQRASEIIAKAQEDAETTLAQRKRTLAQQHEAAKVRAASSAQLEAASLRLRAQHGVVERVFEEAERELTALSQDKKRYRPILQKLLQEAQEGLRGDIGSVSANPAETDAVNEALKSLKLQAEVKPDPSVRGGVKVKSAHTNVAVSNSLFERLESAREELASEVSRLLLSDKAA